MHSLQLGHCAGLRAACPRRAGRGRLVVKAAGSTYGNNFRVTTFGESHGGGVGCVVDGVPPRLHITQACGARMWHVGGAKRWQPCWPGAAGWVVLCREHKGMKRARRSAELPV